MILLCFCIGHGRLRRSRCRAALCLPLKNSLTSSRQINASTEIPHSFLWRVEAHGVFCFDEVEKELRLPLTVLSALKNILRHFASGFLEILDEIHKSIHRDISEVKRVRLNELRLVP